MVEPAAPGGLEHAHQALETPKTTASGRISWQFPPGEEALKSCLGLTCRGTDRGTKLSESELISENEDG